MRASWDERRRRLEMNIHERRAYEQWRRDGAIIEFVLLILAAVGLLVYWWWS